jgi:NADP-dependent 3-hydroxy acid dehydrogenase YdfG
VTSDQIAVISGATSGIGKAIAFALAARGASLCLLGRRKELLDDVAGRAHVTAARVSSYRIDLTQDEEIAKLAAQVGREWGRVDLLLHSAGVFSLGRLEVASVAELDWQYRINVRAPYLLTQAFLPLLRPPQGQIVFVNSSAGLAAKAQVSQYAATKHALKAIADSLREEVNADGVRVLSVYPGRTATPMQAQVHEMEGRAYHPEQLMQPEDVATAVVNAITLPRSAELTDLHIRPSKKCH